MTLSGELETDGTGGLNIGLLCERLRYHVPAMPGNKACAEAANSHGAMLIALSAGLCDFEKAVRTVTTTVVDMQDDQ